MSDQKRKVVELNTEQVLHSLMKMHEPTKWAFFDELRIGTGKGKDSEQRLDAYAINYYPSKRNVTRCYEIKVSRGDFFNEIKKPWKKRAGLRLSNEFYFVTPQGLVDIEEVPNECGLMEVDEKHEISTTLKAPFRDVHPPTWLFVSSICRRLDGYRLKEYMHYINEDSDLKMYGDAAIQMLDYHINMWQHYSEGNKEVPDKIVRALRQVHADIIETIKEKKMF